MTDKNQSLERSVAILDCLRLTRLFWVLRDAARKAIFVHTAGRLMAAMRNLVSSTRILKHWLI